MVEVHLLPDGRSDNPFTAADRPPPVRLRTWPDWVRLAEGDGPELVLGGNQADLVRLLAEAGEPQHWTQIARYFWPEREAASWRPRFDAMMKEVRRKLRQHRVRGVGLSDSVRLRECRRPAAMPDPARPPLPLVSRGGPSVS